MKPKIISLFIVLFTSITWAMAPVPSNQTPPVKGQYIVANEDGGFTLYPTGDKVLKKVKHPVKGLTGQFDFTYYSKDTTNLEYALNKAKPGSSVILAAGTFYISKCIFVDNFQGSLSGNGLNSTYLVVSGVLDGGVSRFPLLTRKESPLELRAPSVFWFKESDENGQPIHLKLANLTIKVEAETHETVIGLPWPRSSISLDSIITVTGKKPDWPVYDQAGIYAGAAKDDKEISQAEITIDHVRFEGGATGDLFAEQVSNVGRAISLYGGYDIDQAGNWRAIKPINASLKVTNCQFKSLQLGAIYVAGSVSGDFNALAWKYPYGSGQAVVQIENNDFYDVASGTNRSAITFVDCNVAANVENNRFGDCRGGVVMLLGGMTSSLRKQLWYPTAQSSFNILNNQVYLTPLELGGSHAGIDAFVVADFSNRDSAQKSLDVTIAHNFVNCDDTFWGVVWGYGADNTVVDNNEITGRSFAPAVYLAVADDVCRSWQIRNNNLKGYHSNLNVPIWLGSQSRSCFVLGSGFEVYDQGMGNILNGINSVLLPFQLEINEAVLSKIGLLTQIGLEEDLF